MYYDITFYPLILNIPFEIADEISNEREFCEVDATESRVFFKIENQEEFEQIMEGIFNSEILRTIMANLKKIASNNAEDEFQV